MRQRSPVLHSMVPARAAAVVVAILGSFSAFATGEPQALDTRMASFRVDGADMPKFVSELAKRTGVVCGVALYSQSELDLHRDAVWHSVTVDGKNTTAREVLDAAMGQPPAYQWFPVEGNFVNILPVDEVQNPDSRFWRHVPPLSVENETVQNATFKVGRAAGVPMSVAYMGGDDTLDRLVSFSFQGGTYLNALNALFMALGENIGWYANVRADMMAVYPNPARLSEVVTQDLGVALAYLQTPAAERDEAARLLEQALTTAPYEALRAQIGFWIACLYRGNTTLFPDSPNRDRIVAATPLYEKAIPFFENVLKVRNRELEHYTYVITGLASCYKHTGQTEKARQLLTASIQSKEKDVFLDPTDLTLALIYLDAAENEPAATLLERMEGMRELFPGNAAYHQRLEERMTLVQEQARSEAKHSRGRSGGRVRPESVPQKPSGTVGGE